MYCRKFQILQYGEQPPISPRPQNVPNEPLNIAACRGSHMPEMSTCWSPFLEPVLGQICMLNRPKSAFVATKTCICKGASFNFSCSHKDIMSCTIQSSFLHILADALC